MAWTIMLTLLLRSTLALRTVTIPRRKGHKKRRRGWAKEIKHNS